MLLRRAESKDVRDIFLWRNDAQTRAMSRNAKPLDEQAHNVWFKEALVDPDRVLLLGVILEIPVGMVRFDKQSDVKSWEISITLAPCERGKGFGRVMLMLAVEHFFFVYPSSILLAEVKQSNIVSRRLFESAGYRHESNHAEILQFSLSCK